MKSSFLFQVFPSSGVPIYRQLMNQVKDLVGTGKLQTGDKLPSVRQVSKELEINPMTVSKTYSLLERDGVIEHERGHGMTIRSPAGGALSVKERQAALAPIARQLAATAFQLSLSQEQVLQIVAPLLKEFSHE